MGLRLWYRVWYRFCQLWTALCAAVYAIYSPYPFASENQHVNWRAGTTLAMAIPWLAGALVIWLTGGFRRLPRR